MSANIIKKVRDFVEKECEKPTSKYGYDVYKCHLVPMVKYAEELSDELGADKEVVILAGWLHDVGAIIEGRENHHITGAAIAERKLKELNYPIEKIELVKKCILNHRGSMQNNRESLEEKIIAEADTISNFDYSIPGIFKASFVYEDLSQEEARQAVVRKLKNKYAQLHFKKSKELAKPKYDAAMLLFEY